jgi:hypothetical protein
MGCCLLAIFGAVWPRLALAYLYFFTGIPARVFKTTLWPLLGFVFLPTTTLAYELCVNHWGSAENIWSMVIIIVALLHDVGHLGGFRKRRQRE